MSLKFKIPQIPLKFIKTPRRNETLLSICNLEAYRAKTFLISHVKQVHNYVWIIAKENWRQSRQRVKLEFTVENALRITRSLKQNKKQIIQEIYRERKRKKETHKGT